MKLVLTHAEVEQIVLDRINNNYQLPMPLHRMEIVNGDFDPTTFVFTHDPTRNGARPTWKRRIFNAMTFYVFA